MPIYEYYCKNCKKTFEMMKSILDESETCCSNCLLPMSKIVSQSTFILKGDGWYATKQKKKKE